MEYKIPGTDHLASVEFHKNRVMADHINEELSAPRLYIVGGCAIWTVRFKNIKTIGDFGCGNGGLLDFLTKNLEGIKLYGYDLMPTNVEYAQSKGLDVKLKDITKDGLEWPNLIIMTEVLEHLENPRAFLERIPENTFVIATVPLFDTPEQHDSCHLWIWTEDDFFNMFKECDFEIIRQGKIDRIQIVVARKL